MPVDTTHPSYDRAISAWCMVRDTAFGGGRIVKGKREQYLPPCFGQEGPEYDAYLRRALFFNATKRTLKAFRGFIFAENPEVELGDYESDNVVAFTKDATLSGQTFYDYQKQTVANVISVGRGGSLAEWADPATDDRPYTCFYATEDILNWRYKAVNGRRILILLVLRERSDEGMGTDEYEPDKQERFRVCRLVQTGTEGAYVKYDVYKKDEKGEFTLIDQSQPNRGGKPLNRIPFVFHNINGEEAEPDEVPLEDLAAINVSHYQNSADLEQGRHLCGQPTLVLTGFKSTGEYILGSSKAIVSEKDTATAHFLQINADSLSALSGGMEQKEQQMASLGARMLERQGQGQGGPEAYQTVQIRQSGEVSALTDAAIACSETLSRLLRWIVWWDDRTVDQPEDLTDDVYVELNTDYTMLEMPAADAMALFQIYMQGGISYEVFFDKLQRGGIIPSERKIEEEKAALKERPVALPDGTGPGPGGGGFGDKGGGGGNPFAKKDGQGNGAGDGGTGDGKKPPPPPPAKA